MAELQFSGSRRDFDIRRLGRMAMKSHELSLKINEKIGYPRVIVREKINRQSLFTGALKILEI